MPDYQAQASYLRQLFEQNQNILALDCFTAVDLELQELIIYDLVRSSPHTAFIILTDALPRDISSTGPSLRKRVSFQILSNLPIQDWVQILGSIKTSDNLGIHQAAVMFSFLPDQENAARILLETEKSHPDIVTSIRNELLLKSGLIT